MLKKDKPIPLQWGNLKENRCPKCYGKLRVVGLIMSVYECTEAPCGFRISESRFREIMTKLIRVPRSLKSQMDSLKELNNMNVEGEKLNDWGTEENDEKYENNEENN